MVFSLCYWRVIVATTTVTVVVVREACAVVGGNPADPPNPDSAVVFLQKHGFAARIEGIKNNEYNLYSFLGLRYAMPPVGSRRFQRPLRRFMAGEESGLRTCPPCPQLDSRTSTIIGQEDCLCLSVYAPRLPDGDQGCPVVIFFHGGGYKTGSSAFYGGKHLVQKNVVLVTVQYRLGSLGFLSTNQIDASGNLAIFDMNLAKNWVSKNALRYAKVKDYIEFFGGDPARVVLMGHGSGGAAASLLAMSRMGKNDVAGVVALSGAPLSPGAVRKDPAQHAGVLAERTRCPKAPAEELLSCLRKLPVETIVKADEDIDMELIDTKMFLDDITGSTSAGARVEEVDDLRSLPPILSKSPEDYLKEKQRCPLMTGVTSAETVRAVYGKYSKFLSNKLSEVQDFIKEEVMDRIREIVEGVGGLVPLGSLNKFELAANYYQYLFENSLDVADGLAKVAEATADALFNFPAYQTVKSWNTGGAPAYMYSFEYQGNLTRGSHFLPGFPLTASFETSDDVTHGINSPAHGDELAYLFEPLNEQGSPIEHDDTHISTKDAHVRDAFVSLIAEFALGNIHKNNSKRWSIPIFDTDKDEYLKIQENFTTAKNFRYCQMGIWGNLAERLSSVLCTDLLGSLLKASQLAAAVPSKLPLPIKRPQHLLSTLTASNKDKNYKKDKENKSKSILKKPLDFIG